MKVAQPLLLNEILKSPVEIIDIYEFKCMIRNSTYFDNEQMGIVYRYLYGNEEIRFMSIYELAHKCKEWAYKRGFLYWYENSRLFIKIMYSCKVDFEIDIGEYKKPFEIDIDFKACQWILNNKESV